jgi:Saposin-like type B, region 2
VRRPPQAIGAEGVVVSQCKAFVKEYVPQILDVISKMPPDAVCSSIGLCATGKTVKAAGRVAAAKQIAGAAVDEQQALMQVGRRPEAVGYRV